MTFSEREKLKKKRLFLLDMDGTLYLGNTVFPETLSFLEKIRSQGGKYAFMTNNSSRGCISYINKLKKMGIEASEEDFITSVNATVNYLQRHYPDSKIYVFGTGSFFGELSDSGFNVTTEYSDDTDVLLVGYDTELTYKKLTDACRLLDKGAVFIATNPDWVCPTETGYLPDCGSICEMLTRATGKKPKYIGKPEIYMPLYALKKYGCTKDEAVIVGDRLYTDIKSAVNSGIDSVFVLSGEGKLSDIDEMNITPTFIAENVGQILQVES